MMDVTLSETVRAFDPQRVRPRMRCAQSILSGCSAGDCGAGRGGVGAFGEACAGPDNGCEDDRAGYAGVGACDGSARDQERFGGDCAEWPDVHGVAAAAAPEGEGSNVELHGGRADNNAAEGWSGEADCGGEVGRFAAQDSEGGARCDGGDSAAVGERGLGAALYLYRYGGPGDV